MSILRIDVTGTNDPPSGVSFRPGELTIFSNSLFVALNRRRRAALSYSRIKDPTYPRERTRMPLTPLMGSIKESVAT